jgi:hypothetical protein
LLGETVDLSLFGFECRVMHSDALLFDHVHCIGPPGWPLARVRTVPHSASSLVQPPIPRFHPNQFTGFDRDQRYRAVAGLNARDVIRPPAWQFINWRPRPVLAFGLHIFGEVLRAVPLQVLAGYVPADVAVELVSPPPSCSAEVVGDCEFPSCSAVRPEASKHSR